MDQPSTNGRKTNGQFTRGNKYGRGNPHAQKVAALKSALVGAVTVEDIKQIAKVLVKQAKDGEHAAIRILLPYLVGAIPQTVDPDNLEVDRLSKQCQLIEKKKTDIYHQTYSIPAIGDDWNWLKGHQ